MSFQAYIDNIRAKTGKTPEDFKKLAEKKGLLKPEVKAMEIVAWLKGPRTGAWPRNVDLRHLQGGEGMEVNADLSG
jgi:hypothetical protein